MLVNVPDRLIRPAVQRHHVIAFLTDGRPVGASILKALRPHQWVKNALCLVPPIAAGDYAARTWGGVLVMAAAFCLVASATYLLNDMADLAADRAHPRKCRRPFASGDAPIAAGLVLAPTLLVAGAVLGGLAGGLGILIVYCVTSVAYSFWLKGRPLVDVFVLAGLYTIRLFGGGEASGHPVSLWLLGFASFLFLSLAFIKRVAELQLLATSGARDAAGRGYTVDDLPILQIFGCAATFTSTIVLSLYVQSDTASHVYGHPAMLWGCIPLLLLWQCRMWLATARGRMRDDPVVFAAGDWMTWAVFAGVVLLVAAAWLPALP